MSDIGYAGTSVPDMLEEFKKSKQIAPLIEGGELVEYSAHLVPEGGAAMMPKLYGHGVMIAGDAAGMAINLGYVVRGMDFAIESGRLAAETYIELAAKHDFTPKAMSLYRQKLSHSFVLKEMRKHRLAPKAFGNRNIFTRLPELADEVMKSMFTVDGEHISGLAPKVIKAVGHYGPARLVKDLLQIICAV